MAVLLTDAALPELEKKHRFVPRYLDW